jgi:hypothetical protein
VHADFGTKSEAPFGVTEKPAPEGHEAFSHSFLGLVSHLWVRHV